MLVIAGGIFYFTRARGVDPVEPTVSGISIYSRPDCPHCTVVDTYLKDKGFYERFSVAKKNILGSENNRRELYERAAACGIRESDIGVPFLADGTVCLMGDTPIIDYFEKKQNES